MKSNMQELLKEWQHRLRLDDWVIVLKENCSPNDMQLNGVAGETVWQEVNQCAVIRIISDKDFGDRIVTFDKEATLVHELLHIKFAFIQESGDALQDRIVHQLIESLAKALVDAKRSDNGDKL